MKPGRELDTLVAEKVMGETEKAYCTNCEDLYAHCSCMRSAACYAPYSTDIAAAWDVVGRIRNSDKQTWGQFAEALRPLMTFGDLPLNPEFWILLVTADRICLAALKAVGALP